MYIIARHLNDALRWNDLNYGNNGFLNFDHLYCLLSFGGAIVTKAFTLFDDVLVTNVAHLIVALFDTTVGTTTLAFDMFNHARNVTQFFHHEGFANSFGQTSVRFHYGTTQISSIVDVHTTLYWKRERIYGVFHFRVAGYLTFFIILFFGVSHLKNFHYITYRLIFNQFNKDVK